MGFLFTAEPAEHVVEFVRGEVDLFVVIEVVHLLYFDQELVPKFKVNDWSDLEEEVEFLDEVSAEGEIAPRHIVFHDVDQAPVDWVAQKIVVFQFLHVQVQLRTNRNRILLPIGLLQLKGLHFL